MVICKRQKFLMNWKVVFFDICFYLNKLYPEDNEEIYTFGYDMKIVWKKHENLGSKTSHDCICIWALGIASALWCFGKFNVNYQNEHRIENLSCLHEHIMTHYPIFQWEMAKIISWINWRLETLQRKQDKTNVFVCLRS